MKKQIIFLIFILVISNSIFAQSLKKFSDDEIARLKFSVHLITYDTISAFDSAKGEAYFKMLIADFSNNGVILSFTPTDISTYDKNKIEKIIQELRTVQQNIPTWKELYEQQTDYLNWIDKAQRKHSKYKTH